MGTRSPQGLAADRLAAKYPDMPSRTLAKKLSESHSITMESARSHIRYSRGNLGKEMRKHAKSPRESQPAGWIPAMPPSLAEPWTPFDIGNDVKVAVISDMHVPFHSTVALMAAVKYLKKFKPDVVFINGDLADFYAISRHMKDPSKRKLQNEMEMVRECLAWLRYEFKKARFVYKLGNHEERWQHWLWNFLPELSDSPRMHIKEWLDADKYGVEIVGDQRPVMVGKLPCMHGHELGKGGVAAPVNPARGLFMRTLSSMLIAHGHRTSQHAEPDWRHELTTCWSIGCLCDMTPEYARINKWNAGAAKIEVDKAGEFEVENFRIGTSGEIWK